MQSNSTDALLQLWHMCVKSQGDEDAEGPVLQWETLKKVMENLPMAQNSSVDDILQRHFGAGRHRGGIVNFTLFWRGMEAILRSNGVFKNTGFSDEILEVIDSLRRFRDLLPTGPSTEEMQMQPLRQIYQRVATTHSKVVSDYWTAKLHDLPDDGLQTVSGDEIAFALLKWLEELIGCDESEDESLEPEHERQPEAAVLRLALPQEATSSQGWSWLGRASDPEVTSFRQRMLRLLPQDQDHALLHFYRAVRDAMDAGQIGSPCSHERLRVTRASLRGSVALLERVAMREVRGAFRQLQRAAFGRRPSLMRGDSALAPRPSTPRSEGCGIMAGLVCSQAVAAQVLDRRANLAPRAFYMAWLLERARRRCLVSVLSLLRSKLARKESPSRRLGRPAEAVPKEVPSSSPSRRRVLARSKTPTKTAIV